MKQEKPLIRIVDDEEDQRFSLEMMLSCEGWDVVCYASAEEFIRSDMPSRPGCLILDVRMPGMSGIEAQKVLNERQYPLPIIFLTGHADVDMAVHALKSGAKDFLQKPVQCDRLLTAIAEIVQKDLDARQQPIDEGYWQQKFRSLTEREQGVIRLVASGLLNKQIAERCGISEKTVQAHRLAAYRKLEVHSVADLAPLTVLLKQEKLPN